MQAGQNTVGRRDDSICDFTEIVTMPPANDPTSNVSRKRKVDAGRTSISKAQRKLLREELTKTRTQLCTMKSEMDGISESILKFNETSNNITQHITQDTKFAVDEIDTLRRRIFWPSRKRILCNLESSEED